LKRQLSRSGIGFEALDNGVLSCEQPEQAQRLATGLTAGRIKDMIERWLLALPHPFTPEDRRARYCYDVSILQAEFSLTQVLDQPVVGRMFFEQIIRDNLDLGRPDRVQLVFARRISRRTPGRFRTRVITEGVIPTLYIDYKHTAIKQYHKEGRALRTETTINDPGDFDLGKRLKNLSALRKVGFQANRRLLDVQRTSHDCPLGEQAFANLHKPHVVGQHKVPGLRFGDERVLALLSALVLFRLQPNGFAHRHLREQVSQLLGRSVQSGQMTYDLRRLRLHGLIVRRSGTHRYDVTPLGFRAALFLTRSYNRLLRPGMAALTSNDPSPYVPLRHAIERVDRTLDQAWKAQQIAA
jgi:hypothetical protein